MSKPTILITGSNGTIGNPLSDYLLRHGFTVKGWARDNLDIGNYSEMEAYVREISPDVLIHLAAITSFDPQIRINSWQVNYEWPSELAWICRALRIKFIFTSSTMVFSPANPGPYTISAIPDAEQGYGFEKRKAEERVLYQNPESVILRMGWQIAKEGRNSMITHFENEFRNKGVLDASSNFLPSCSFVEDTCRVLHQSIDFKPGIYQVNANDNWNLYRIANALNTKFNYGWQIREQQQPAWNQRMVDERIAIGSLSDRLEI